MAGEFLDSNILVYAVTDDPRAETAQMLLQRRCAISVQSLNEFVNVARRKLRLPWLEIRDALSAIRTVCPTVVPVDADTHNTALDLAEQHGFAIFDALIIAAALHAESHTLWSEDMQDGMVVRGTLRIANPFRVAV